MKMQTTVPFPGFYCSWLDYGLNQELEKAAEHLEEEHDVDVSKAADRIFEHTDWRKAHQHLTQTYLRELIDLAAAYGDETNLGNLTFVKLDSPRFYNFETDRLFAEIEFDFVRHMLATVNSQDLEDRIKEKFTSRSGFVSFYSNDINQWITKDLIHWDINEVGTLFEVYLEQEVSEELDETMMYRMDEGEIYRDALDNAIDWAKVETQPGVSHD